jgi:hypothetical protein
MIVEGKCVMPCVKEEEAAELKCNISCGDTKIPFQGNLLF